MKGSRFPNTLQQQMAFTRHDAHTHKINNTCDAIFSNVHLIRTFTARSHEIWKQFEHAGEISKLFIDAGIVVLAAFIAPYEKDRGFIKKTVGPDNYIEVFVNTSLEECERRDVKGLYQKARKGEIKNMTGISAPYEHPIEPDIEVSNEHNIEESVDIIYNKIKNQKRLKK